MKREANAWAGMLDTIDASRVRIAELMIQRARDLGIDLAGKKESLRATFGRLEKEGGMLKPDRERVFRQVWRDHAKPWPTTPLRSDELLNNLKHHASARCGYRFAPIKDSSAGPWKGLHITPCGFDTAFDDIRLAYSYDIVLGSPMFHPASELLYDKLTRLDGCPAAFEWDEDESLSDELGLDYQTYRVLLKWNGETFAPRRCSERASLVDYGLIVCVNGGASDWTGDGETKNLIWIAGCHRPATAQGLWHMTRADLRSGVDWQDDGLTVTAYRAEFKLVVPNSGEAFVYGTRFVVEQKWP